MDPARATTDLHTRFPVHAILFPMAKVIGEFRNSLVVEFLFGPRIGVGLAAAEDGENAIHRVPLAPVDPFAI